MEPAYLSSYFGDIAVVEQSSSPEAAGGFCSMRHVFGLLAVVILLVAGVSIGYCGCTYLVSQAEEKDESSSEPDDELVFDCAVPMNQPSVSGKQPQYTPLRPAEIGSPVVTYNVAVLV